MTEIIYKFNTEDDSNHLVMVQMAEGMWHTLYAVESDLRQMVKHAEADDKLLPGVERSLDLLREYLAHYSVDLHEVC